MNTIDKQKEDIKPGENLYIGLRNMVEGVIGVRVVKSEVISSKVRYKGEELEYGIRKIESVDGSVEYIPLVREKHFVFQSKWSQIVRVENTYRQQTEVERFGLTYEQCQERIEGYREVLAKRDAKLTKLETTYSYK